MVLRTLHGFFLLAIWLGVSMAWAQDKSSPERVYQIDSERSLLRVHTNVAGLLKALGKPLTLRAHRINGEIRFRGNDPASARVNLQVDPNGIALETAVSRRDKEEIEGTMYDDVLNTADHREIRFESITVKGKKLGGSRYRVDIMGKLTLTGETRTLPVAAEVELREGELKAGGHIQFKQTMFEIKPYVAVGGAIKLKDEVKVSFDIHAKAR